MDSAIPCAGVGHCEVEFIGIALRGLLSEDLESSLFDVEVTGSQDVVLFLLEEAVFLAGGGLGALFVVSPLWMVR